MDIYVKIGSEGEKTMITLYITRHGETVWNTEKRMQGRLDSKLTETGERNALALGEKLKDVELNAIVSSPSGRTKDTAQLIRMGRDIPVYYDENLMEMHLGQWEGQQQASIQENDPVAFELFWNKPHLFEPVGGESFEEMKSRILKALHDIEKKFTSGNILIVTHTVVIKCLLSIFKNASLENFWDPPFIHDTSLTIVEVNEHTYELILEGDIAHRLVT